AWGTFGANANNKRVKFKFGASSLTFFDSGYNNLTWFVSVLIVRTGATGQEIAGYSLVPTNVVGTARATGAETLSGAITIQFTGEATADSDILQHGMIVEGLN
ncbi:MAG TPA: hypothetical protein VGQ24_00640, partial [Gemmatimonadales bacterium]|nr:hypothetical protein [Gemmatimonadales bacterium]